MRRFLSSIHESPSERLASSSGASFSDYEQLVESLMEVARKESELADERAKYLDDLSKLTERNEKLMKYQHEKEMGTKVDPDTQAAMIVALEEQNGLLRRMVEEKEDEITVLEKKMALIESAGHVSKTTVEASGSEEKTPMAGIKYVIDEKEYDAAEAAREKLTEEAKQKLDQSLVDAAYRRRTALATQIISKGADVDARDKFGKTSLMWASSADDLKTVKALISWRADVDAKDESGRTAMMLACLGGHSRIVQLLLDNGADLSIREADSFTAISLAVYCNYGSVVSTLISAGADLNIVLKNDETILDYAESQEYSDVVRLLRTAGAERARDLR